MSCTECDYENFLYQNNNQRKHADDDTVFSNQLEQFDLALAQSSRTVQLQNYQSFEQLLLHWETLKLVLDQLMQLEAPSFAHIDSQLEDIHKSLKKIYKADQFQYGSDTLDTSSTLEISTDTRQLPQTETAYAMPLYSQQGFQPSPQSHLQNREQAIKVLQDIADYFQTHEPHSPVSYMLQKTVKWSQMPLHEWLAQVIKQENPLESVQELLGISSTNNETSNW